MIKYYHQTIGSKEGGANRTTIHHGLYNWNGWSLGNNNNRQQHAHKTFKQQQQQNKIKRVVNVNSQRHTKSLQGCHTRIHS